jgi:hypothetical protein
MVVWGTLLLPAILPYMVSSFADQIVSLSHLGYSC